MAVQSPQLIITTNAWQIISAAGVGATVYKNGYAGATPPSNSVIALVGVTSGTTPVDTIEEVISAKTFVNLNSVNEVTFRIAPEDPYDWFIASLEPGWQVLVI